ncbi:MAG: DHA2 family efflux MFS transporter permease subunit [Acidimicrobiales bacterium]
MSDVATGSTVEATDEAPAQGHARRWLVLAVLCFSLLLIVIDNTIVNVALPTIQSELGASTSQLQWVVDAYILVFAGLLLTAGALGDRFGRRGALSIGLLIMGTSAALSAMATEPSQLIATRALMGVGAALIMPATLSILTNVFTDPKERGRAIAIWAGVAGMGVALGPVTGGWLLDHFWWGSVFLVNIPVVALAFVAGRLLVPTSRSPHAVPVDLPGAALSIAGLVSLVWAIISAGEHGWTDGSVLSAFGVAAVLLGAFVWWERRTTYPMLDMNFFTNRRFSAASGAITLTFFALFGSFFLLTQYLQFVLGYTPLEAGIRLLPMAGVMMVIAPASARLVEGFGTKAVVGSGLLIAAGGLFSYRFLTAGSSYIEVVASMIVLAVGMSLVMAPATESIMGSLPPAKAGVGSAVNDTTREVGGALGVAVLGSLLSGAYTSQMTDALASSPNPLPPEAAGAVTEQLGGALAVAGRLGGSTGQALADAARTAFVDGMGTALTVGSIVVLVAAAAVFLFLPSRAAEPSVQPAVDDDELDRELAELEAEIGVSVEPAEA